VEKEKERWKIMNSRKTLKDLRKLLILLLRKLKGLREALVWILKPQ